MKKKLFTMIVAAMAATSVFAETATIDYTYANGTLFQYGKEKRETVDVAMCIDDPELAGMKITGFKAYISTTEGILTPSLWMSSELTIANKANVPDIASYEVTPEKCTIGTMNAAVMSVTLPEPYLLTGAPVYLGYTITVDEINTNAQKNPIILSKGDNPNGLFVHMSKTILKWLNYVENAEGVAYIVAEIEGDFPENTLGFTGSEAIYAESGEPFEGVFMVSNIGVNPIESVGYVYSFDDDPAEYTGTATPAVPIEPALVGSSVLPLSFQGVSGFGPHTLHVTITEVNGVENESASPSISCVVDVVPFKPTRRVLVEEYTGLWCGWCPSGYIAMEMIAEDYGDSQVSVCYHSDDAMAVTSNFAVDVRDFPGATVDRGELVNPYYGYDERTQYGIAAVIDDALAVETFADIDITALLDGDTLTARAAVRFVKDIAEADYEVGFVLTCSGLTNRTWIQENYYSGRSGYAGTPLEVLTTWAPSVSGLVFNDVAVDVTGMKGLPGSIPVSVVNNTEYNADITFNISNNKLIQNRENLTVVGYLIDKATGRIINSNKCTDMNSLAGVAAVAADVVSTDYFDISGRRLLNPAPGTLCIRIDRLSDGSSRTTKTIR